MSFSDRLLNASPGKSLRVNSAADADQFFPAKTQESFREFNEIRDRYPGDRCTFSDPSGNGMPSIAEDHSEWVAKINEKYLEILYGPIKKTAEMALKGTPEDILEEIVKDFLKELIEQWLKNENESKLKSEPTTPKPENINNEDTRDPLTDRIYGDGGLPYAGDDKGRNPDTMNA